VKGEGVSIDFRGAAHSYKLAAALNNYGNCLKEGEDVSRDLKVSNLNVLLTTDPLLFYRQFS
jgi:TPR repeat protein